MNTRDGGATVDSETQVVGALLVDPSRIRGVAKLLRPADFSDPYHRTTFDVLTAMDRAGEPVDIVTVKHRLERWELFRTGGVDSTVYLAETGRDLQYAPHVERHAEIVATAAKKRRVFDVASNAADRAMNGEPVESVIADLWSGVEDLRREADPTARDLEALTLAEFLQLDHRQDFLIENTVVAAQPGCVSAKSKSLKTTVSLAASIALATGRPFLNRWEVPEPQPCGIISAESGGATLAESFERIASSMGLFASEIDRLIVSTKMPLLTTAEGRDQLERHILKYGLRALWVDPSYKAFAGVDDSSLSQMALHLFPLSETIERTGCSVIIVQHNKKTPARQGEHYAEPTIDDILGSGFQQWARFFLLLNKRREWDANEGRHWLWLKTEGSAGFGSRQWLDVTEGRRSDPGGRTWQVTLSDPIEGAEQERQQQAAEREAAKLEGERRAVCNVLAIHPSGLSWSRAFALANISTRRRELVKETMIDEGDVEEIEITVSNHKTPQPGIKLAKVEAA